VVIVIFYGIIAIHDIPAQIAEKRHHPHVGAIHAAGVGKPIDLRKHNIESQVNLSEQLPPVVGNEVQLQQVILNLVTNAIESMNSAETRVLSIKSENTGHNGIRVSIADTGSGIDLANLKRLFELRPGCGVLCKLHERGSRVQLYLTNERPW